MTSDRLDTAGLDEDAVSRAARIADWSAAEDAGARPETEAETVAETLPGEAHRWSPAEPAAERRSIPIQRGGTHSAPEEAAAAVAAKVASEPAPVLASGWMGAEHVAERASETTPPPRNSEERTQFEGDRAADSTREPAPTAEADDNAPRRKGWWQRKFL